MIDIPENNDNSLTEHEKQARVLIGELKQNVVKTEIDVVERISSIFLGGDTQVKNVAKKAAMVLTSRDRAKERGNEKEYIRYNAQLEAIKKEHYPSFTEQELASYLMLFVTFYTRMEQKALRDSDIITQVKGFINFFYGKDQDGVQTLTPLINGDIPSIKPTQSMRDQMRRHHLAGTTANADSFRVLLPNSFILLRLKRPTRLQLAKLIDNIFSKLKMFGRTFAISSVHLERAGIVREIMEMVYGLVEYSSVKGITDPYELSKYILINDVDVICAELLKAGSPKGVNYHLTCLAKQCNFSDVITIQPEEFTILPSQDLTEAQSKIYSELLNSAKKLTVEEMLELQNKYVFNGKPVDVVVNAYNGVDIDSEDIVNKRPTSTIVLAVPTLETYFNCFDKMAKTYDPKLKEYMQEFPKETDYRRKRAEFMGSVRMGEYIHWIAEYRVKAAPGVEDAEDIVYTRDNTDPNYEFEDGILDIMSEDEEMYGATFSRIIQEMPKATHVFTGLVNSEACPNCRKKAKGLESNLEITLEAGFTPIDMVMNFFDRTQMQIEKLATLQMVQEEIVS